MKKHILHYFAPKISANIYIQKITLIFYQWILLFSFPSSLCPKVYQVPSHDEPIHQLDPPPPLSLSVLHYQDPSTPYGPEASSSTRFSSFFVFWLFSFLCDSVAAYTVLKVEFWGFLFNTFYMRSSRVWIRYTLAEWWRRSSRAWMRYSRMWMRSSRVWMRSSRVVDEIYPSVNEI